MNRLVKKILLNISFLTGMTLSFGQSLEEKILTSNTTDDRYASYSPDGNQIVFESNREGNWNIYLMKSDGTDQHRLTSSENNSRRPSWHLSGKKILFESNMSGKSELYEINVKNKRIKK